MHRTILSVLFVSSFSFAACTCDSQSDKETILKGKTTKGAAVVIRIPSKPVTKESKKVFVCNGERQRLKGLELWMPEHGHGSLPTAVNEVSNDCATVEKIKFLMTGTWDLRLAFESADKATVSVTVR
ncbi:MAG: hypothetical protein HYZ71_14510 [Deltaproteobacteria bacterium]|nr:hypothetical protein [Deltaproteobacteria bacterium]